MSEYPALQNHNVSVGKIDGVMGPKTIAGIRTFQQKNALTADGIVGPKTWAALQGVSSTTTIQPSTTTGGFGDDPGFGFGY